MKIFKQIILPVIYVFVGAVLDWFLITNSYLLVTKFDDLSILEAALTFAIATLAIVGGIAAISTWNDIDERAEKIMKRHGEKIDAKFLEAEGEYGRKSKEALEKIELQKLEIDAIKNDVELAKNDINGTLSMVYQMKEDMTAEFKAVSQIYAELNGKSNFTADLTTNNTNSKTNP